MDDDEDICNDSMEICNIYAGYLDVASTNLMSNVDEEIDGIQKSMDELYTTLLSLEETNGEVVDERLSEFLKKAIELESVFGQIDTIYSSVSNISSNLAQLEAAANAIDKQIYSNPLKKVLGFFKSSVDNESNKVYIPAIFSTEDVFETQNNVRKLP